MKSIHSMCISHVLWHHQTTVACAMKQNNICIVPCYSFAGHLVRQNKKNIHLVPCYLLVGSLSNKTKRIHVPCYSFAVNILGRNMSSGNNGRYDRFMMLILRPFALARWYGRLTICGLASDVAGAWYLRWGLRVCTQVSRPNITHPQAAADAGVHNGRPARLGSQKTKIKQKYTQSANSPVQCS